MRPKSQRADQVPRPALAVVIPAFDERHGVAKTVTRVHRALAASDIDFEIVVVDDGSQDGTGDVAAGAGARVVRIPTNQGYGAALKVGIRATDSTYVAIIDADGTYPPDRLSDLFELAQDADMAVGARAPDAPEIQRVRRPAKRFLTWLARYLSGTPIPDLNSGMRIMRRSVLVQFMPILPSGFSFTTTITLSMLCTGHLVRYLPVEYSARIGQSKIRPVDFFRFVVLVVRAILLFNPLKVFLPLGAVFFVLGLLESVRDLFRWELSEGALIAYLAAVIIWGVGALADMISRLQLGSLDRS